MSIENNDVDINNEEELEINLEDETPEPEPKVEEKPAETLEARKARLERQLEQTNKKLGVTEPKEVKTSKSDSLGYGEKAFLVANGIKGLEETNLFEQEFKKSNGTMEELLESPYFQEKLAKSRELAKTADSVPPGKRSSTMPTDSVEYWMGKDIKDVPQEMVNKVVKARLAKEKNAGTFYNS